MLFRSKKSADPVAQSVASLSELTIDHPQPTALPPTPVPSQLPSDPNRFAISFAHIVMLLMRSPQYQALALADLKWMVMPALLSNQCAVLESNETPVGTPREARAMALWATVSPAVDARLQQDQNPALQLAADDWRSGDIIWLIDAVGEGESVQQLVGHLRQVAFQGRDVRLRTWTGSNWQAQTLPGV
jgi:hemolysin-activating ACP:hemolysin acyltransferase